MKNVTFKYENADSTHVYTMEFNPDGMPFDEFMEEVKKFAILLGYSPETIDDALSDECLMSHGF